MPIPNAQTAADAPAGEAPRPARDPRLPERFEPVAGFLALLLPGLGQLVLGEPARAALIASGVLGLFFGGILIGGIDAIDSKEDTIWFAGQALVGPVAIGVDYLHQNHLKIKQPGNAAMLREQGGVLSGGVLYRSARPDEDRAPSGLPGSHGPGIQPPNSKSLGRMNELGTLFATIAGMLNLIVIIDAFYHARRRPD